MPLCLCGEKNRLTLALSPFYDIFEGLTRGLIGFIIIGVRKWRNWYTRTFEGRVRKGGGSSPPFRTIFVGE
jgi:hypothetical protein